ncbi:hypothetical protein PDJAM_G00085810, partial [Pangasius djambal]|nr:hypothetical protein [Pangasius djambal]
MVLRQCSLQERILEVTQCHHTVLMNVLSHGQGHGHGLVLEVVLDHGLVVKMLLDHGLLVKMLLG